MCSNKWAKPVLPGRSFFEPTWYQTLTATIGVERSSCRMICKPLGSWYFSKAISGSRTALAGSAAPAKVEAQASVIITIIGSPLLA